MGIFALFSLLSSLIILFLGIYIYSYRPKHILNRMFFLLCLIEAYIAFIEFQVRQSYNFETADLWLRIGAFWPLVVSVIVHFLLIFMEKSEILKSKLTYFLIYIPPLIFSLFFLTNTVNMQPVKEYWGWTYTLPEKSLLFNLIIIWLTVLLIFCIFLCLHYYIRIIDYNKKKQVILVLIGIFIPFIVCITTEYFFHLFQIKFPELTSVSVILECGLLGYAIRKYELFKLTPLDALENIISIMSDSLILVDPDKRISAVNKTALKLLGYEEHEIIGQPVEILLEEQDKYALLHENQKRTNTDTETTFKSKDGRYIPILLSTSLVTDKKGITRGIIYAGRDITERKRSEEELSRHRNHLEKLVKERTIELKSLNENLESEIVERKMVESTLRENEGKLNAIFQSINDHIIMLDKDLNIIWANKTTKKVYGKDITDRKCYEVFHHRNRPCEPYPCITLNAFKDGKMHTQETRIVNKDGEEHFFQCTANVALRNSEGQTEGVLEIFRDITEIMKKSEELKHSQEILKDKAHDLEEANVALNVLLRRRDEEKQNLEKNILANIKTLITPYLEKLERKLSEPGQKALVEELKINFAHIIKPFARQLTEISSSLSPTEIQIAELTREGKTAKEISEFLNISEYTVKAHKRHIRDKLGIRSKKVNLQSYLQSYFKE